MIRKQIDAIPEGGSWAEVCRAGVPDVTFDRLDLTSGHSLVLTSSCAGGRVMDISELSRAISICEDAGNRNVPIPIEEAKAMMKDVLCASCSTVITCPHCQPAEHNAMQMRINELAAALRPFAELIDRRWNNKDEAIAAVRRGDYRGELKAISLADVLEACRVLNIEPK